MSSNDVVNLEILEKALEGFCELRAGEAGLLKLSPTIIEQGSDPLFALARSWTSLTTYQVTRHLKNVSASEVLRADLRQECRTKDLPIPEILIDSHRGVAGVGLTGRASLKFSVPVPGPLLLGKTLHLGGGLFVSK